MLAGPSVWPLMLAGAKPDNKSPPPGEPPYRAGPSGVKPPAGTPPKGFGTPAEPNGVSPPAAPPIAPPSGASGVRPGVESIGVSVGSSSTSSGGGAAAGLGFAGKPFQGADAAGLGCGAGSGVKGVRAGAAVTLGAPPPGICTTAWQCGHFPFLPAALIGVRTVCPHDAHGNEITAPPAAELPAPGPLSPVPCPLAWAAGFGAALGSGVRPATAAGWLTSGIWPIVPQCGHFPFLPAAASGVRTSWPHAVQENSIGMGLTSRLGQSGIRLSSVFAF